MKSFPVLIALPVLLTAAIVDRVAIAIGNQAITELQIDEDLQVTALLNHQPVSRDVQSRRSAADRLVQQFLIQREMETSRYPVPDAAEIDKYFQKVEADLGGVSRLPDLLKIYELDESTLRDHLARQLAALSFIEFRFRPQFSVADPEVREYLRSQPSANQDSVRQLLIRKQTDDALNAWLEETRKRFDIVYLDKTLQ